MTHNHRSCKWCGPTKYGHTPKCPVRRVSPDAHERFAQIVARAVAQPLPPLDALDPDDALDSDTYSVAPLDDLCDM